ncbi:MAG TPA: hypothetical protein DIT76_08330 [Spartobacteria bacterium]|nr:hypothetical protein [Spartobacteria bacterium]
MSRSAPIGRACELTLRLPFFLFVPRDGRLTVFVWIVHQANLLFLRGTGNKSAGAREQKSGRDFSL